MKTIARHQKCRECIGARAIGLWAAGIAIVTVALATGAPMGLDGPGVDPARWMSWLDRQGAVTAMFSLGRLAVVALGAYLTIVLTAHALAVLTCSTRSSALARGITPLWARRLVELVVGATFTVSAVGSMAAVSARAATAQEVEHPDGLDAPNAPDPLIEVMTVVDEVSDPDAAIEVSGDGAAAGGEAAIAAGASPRSPLELSAIASVGRAGDVRGVGDGEGPAPAPVDLLAVGEVWEVERGDHLWAIAEQTLASAWGAAPSDREVAVYWSALVDHVRPLLADPSNPDLIFPGQVFELVPVPERLGD